MKIALLSAMFPDLALEKLIPAIAAWGYDAIELNAEELPWAAPHVTPQTDVAVRILVKSVAAEHGLGISAVCAHTSLVSADPDASTWRMTWTPKSSTA
jgi:sugar phosphate isomerase/epimerase